MMRRALVSVLAVGAALVLQLAVVNRLPLPGGSGPDLVLVTVAALAVIGGPAAGMLTGFLGGLALDVAPPGSHLTGEYALVFCLVGYLCGEAGAMGERAPLSEVALTAAGAAAGEALQAALGVMVSDPRVTWAAVRHVLPAAVAYNVLLSPFVLWIVAVLALRSEEPDTGPLTGGQAARAPRDLVAPGALRLAAEVPRLRLAGSGGRLAAAGPGTAAGRREPKLNLSGSRGGSSFLSRTGAGIPAGQPSALGGRTAKVGFASRGRWSRGGVIGGSVLGGSVLGGGALGPSLFAGPRPAFRFPGGPREGWLAGGSRPGALGGSSPGGSLLGGSVLGRTGGRPGAKTMPGKALRGNARRGWLNGSSANSVRAKAPRGKALRGSSLSLGAAAGKRAAATPQFRKRSRGGLLNVLLPWRRPRQRVASPGRGWLSAKPPRRTWQPKSPGRGWLGRTPGSYSRRRGARSKIGGYR